jgi:TonB family protein
MRTVAIAAILTTFGVIAGAPASAQSDLPTATPIGNPGSWIPANGYPPAARASAEEGRVVFTLYVDETGRVSDCKVTTSSESPLLDETTCAFMSANGRFTPPRDKKNKPVPSKWSSAMRWKLEVAPPEPVPATGTPATPATLPALPAGKAKGATPLGNPATWFTDRDYPADARKRGEKGEVKVQLSLDVAGTIKGCTVTKTSGSAQLDLLTCDLLRKRARFAPATDAKGAAIVSTYAVGANWMPK